MSTFLIGREKQIAELNTALNSSKPEMVALVGRRRVGKTYLIQRTYEDRINFELTGIQNTNLAGQLANFSYAVEQYFPNRRDESLPKDWLAAFHQLGKLLDEHRGDKKQVVFLDELPWLSAPRSGFLEALGFFWNSWATKRNVVVVICGSAASWMIRKVIHHRGGLHNRVTRLIQLLPFTLAETESYCRARQLRLDRYQLLQIYMVMGGIPLYLDFLEPGKSAVQNIQDICFAPLGYLKTEFDRLFSSLFEQYEKHVAVVRALAGKRKGLTRKELVDNARIGNGGSLSRVLDELETSGFINIYSGYHKKTRERLYRLTDFYTHFYLTFLEKLGRTASVDFSQLSDLSEWKTWSGYTFENVCLAHIPQIKRTLALEGIASSVATFVARSEEDTPGAQIDLLIDRSDQTINLCEAKFSVKEFTVDKRTAENFARKKDVFRHHTKTRKQLFLTLITTFGVKDNQHRREQVDQVITLNDLFAPR